MSVIRWITLNFLFLFTLSPLAFATAWIEISEKMLADDNIFSYIVPYPDSYSTLNVRFNLKDKLQRTTHYSIFTNTEFSAYGLQTQKNYLQNNLGLGLEEDIAESLVALVNSQLIWFDYFNSQYSTYDYFWLTLTPNLRFFIFAFDFTSIDWGLEYNVYALPNYNFETEGWVPTLNFREEVAEYHGFGTFLAIKQALPAMLDLDLTGKIAYQYCPERPLYLDVNVFSDERRSDLETTLSVGLTKRLERNSYVKLSFIQTAVQSNANAQVLDAVSGVEIQPEYYSRSKNRLTLDGLFYFGQEGTYIRGYASYSRLAYTQRPAQASDGTFGVEPRADTEYSALVEINQPLGNALGVSWMLKLGYQFTQNMTNDFYYRYTREILNLGLTTYLYL